MLKTTPPPFWLRLSKYWNDFDLLYSSLIISSILLSSLVIAIAGSYLLVNISPVAAIASVLAVPAILLFLAKPELGLMLVILILPLEELSTSGDFSAIKLISTAVFGCTILNYLILRPREPLVRAPQNSLIVLFLMVSLLSVFIATNPSQALDRLPKLLRVLALYFFVINLIRSEKYFRIALWMFVIGGFFCTLYGFLDPTQVGERFQGALGQPNGYALTMMPRIPIALALLFIEKNNWKKIILLFFLLTIAYGIIHSGSRGGLLSISLALILFAMFQKNKTAGIALISFIFILGFLIMPQDIKTRIGLSGVSASSDLGNSTDRRLTYQIYGAELFQEHPILGIGLDGFAESYAQSEFRFLIRTQELRVAHNTYLEIATGTGIIGLIPFLGILVLAISLALKYSRKKSWGISSDLAILSTGLFAALGGYYLGMFFGSRQYEKTLWFLLALPIIVQILINQTREKQIIHSEQLHESA